MTDRQATHLDDDALVDLVLPLLEIHRTLRLVALALVKREAFAFEAAAVIPRFAALDLVGVTHVIKGVSVSQPTTQHERVRARVVPCL